MVIAPNPLFNIFTSMFHPSPAHSLWPTIRCNKSIVPPVNGSSQKCKPWTTINGPNSDLWRTQESFQYGISPDHEIREPWNNNKKFLPCLSPTHAGISRRHQMLQLWVNDGPRVFCDNQGHKAPGEGKRHSFGITTNSSPFLLRSEWILGPDLLPQLNHPAQLAQSDYYFEVVTTFLCNSFCKLIPFDWSNKRASLPLITHLIFTHLITWLIPIKGTSKDSLSAKCDCLLL